MKLEINRDSYSSSTFHVKENHSIFLSHSSHIGKETLLLLSEIINDFSYNMDGRPLTWYAIWINSINLTFRKNYIHIQIQHWIYFYFILGGQDGMSSETID